MVIVSVCSMFLVIRIAMNKVGKKEDATDSAIAPLSGASSEKRTKRYYPVPQREAEKESFGSRVALEEVV